MLRLESNPNLTKDEIDKALKIVEEGFEELNITVIHDGRILGSLLEKRSLAARPVDWWSSDNEGTARTVDGGDDFSFVCDVDSVTDSLEKTIDRSRDYSRRRQLPSGGLFHH